MEETLKALLTEVEQFLRDIRQVVALPGKEENKRIHLLCRLKDFSDQFIGKNYGFMYKNNSNNVSAVGGDEDRESMVSSQISLNTGSTLTRQLPSSGIALVNASSLQPAIKSGFLIKRRKQANVLAIIGGQKRWCVIKDGIFYYFPNEQSRKQKGAFALQNYEATKSPDNEKKSQFNINLLCPGKRSYHFTAATQEDMSNWVSCINLVSGLKSTAGTTDDDYSSGSLVPQSGKPVTPIRTTSMEGLLNRESTIDGYENEEVIAAIHGAAVAAEVRKKLNQQAAVKPALVSSNMKAKAEQQGPIGGDIAQQDIYDGVEDCDLDYENEGAIEEIHNQKVKVNGPINGHCDELEPEEEYEDTAAVVEAIRAKNGNVDHAVTGHGNSVEPEEDYYEDTEVLEGNHGIQPNRQGNHSRQSTKKYVNTGNMVNSSQDVSRVRDRQSSNQNNVVAKTKSPPGKLGGKAAKTNATDVGNVYSNMELTHLYYALYDCRSDQSDELSFTKHDLIQILRKETDDWWMGTVNGKVGLVPHNYLCTVYERV